MSAWAGLGEGVHLVTRCELVAAQGRWDYADTHAEAIDAHWVRRSAENPALFNGSIYVATAAALTEGSLAVQLLATEFKNYLFWRDAGHPEAGIRDAFGSALLRSREGYVLLGRQRAGYVNEGLAYLPGGFIDPRDVGADGRIDLDASILREVAEETGLEAHALTRQPGYIVTVSGAQLSIAVAFVADAPAAALRARIMDFLAREEEPELVDMVIVRSRAEARAQHMPAYAHVLLDELLA